MTLKFCRICKGRLKQIIDLKKICLVGDFQRSKKKQKKYKISLNFCLVCKHVQISEILKSDLLFKNYLWETGVSKTNLKILDHYIIELKKLGFCKNSRLLEIASNDGSLVNKVYGKFKNINVGVDPAKNYIKKYEKKIKFFNNYFDKKLSKIIKKKFNDFDIIVARNVIAHVAKPHEIFSGFNNLLKKNGIAIIEVPHLLNIIKDNQYDNIFHEHIGFHSLKSISDLCKMNDLKIMKAERIDSQGGSIRCFICKKDSSLKENTSYKSIFKLEKKLGLFKKNVLKNFRKKINDHRVSLIKLLKKIKNENKKISIYGASGKGQALMQYCNINLKIIDQVFDKSKLKIGKFTPGTGIKIKDPKHISNKNIDYLLILAWNIKDEIIKQEKFFKKNSGKFIIPFPKPKIMN